MEFIPTAIDDVVKIVPRVFPDERGFFMETWHAKLFRDNVAEVEFVQDNYSQSSKGTLRGLHYQIEQAQGKLVRVVTGEVFDVAVDMRKSSPTFGQWVGEVLSAENKHQLWVPSGFAHGFLAMSEIVEYEYKCTDYYAPQHERAVLWDDSDIGIEWPLKLGEQPVLSAKDKVARSFANADCFA